MTTTSNERNAVEEANPELAGLGRYDFGWSDSDTAGASAQRGLSEEVVRDISAKKDEPDWMLDLRLKGHKLFGRKPLPQWGADLPDRGSSYRRRARSSDRANRSGSLRRCSGSDGRSPSVASSCPHA